MQRVKSLAQGCTPTGRGRARPRALVNLTLKPLSLFRSWVPISDSTTDGSPSLANIDCSCPFLPPQPLSLSPDCSPTSIYAGLPGNKRLVTMRKATAGRLVKFVTRASPNKIKLKVLLRCQDKGQAAEIIFHSQTLNYPVRLDQIQSKGKKEEKKEQQRQDLQEQM